MIIKNSVISWNPLKCPLLLGSNVMVHANDGSISFVLGSPLSLQNNLFAKSALMNVQKESVARNKQLQKVWMNFLYLHSISKHFNTTISKLSFPIYFYRAKMSSLYFLLSVSPPVSPQILHSFKKCSMCSWSWLVMHQITWIIQHFKGKQLRNNIERYFNQMPCHVISCIFYIN